MLLSAPLLGPAASPPSTLIPSHRKCLNGPGSSLSPGDPHPCWLDLGRTSHTEAGLSQVACFGQWGVSKQDISRSLNRFGVAGSGLYITASAWWRGRQGTVACTAPPAASSQQPPHSPAQPRPAEVTGDGAIANCHTPLFHSQALGPG